MPNTICIYASSLSAKLAILLPSIGNAVIFPKGESNQSHFLVFHPLINSTF